MTSQSEQKCRTRSSTKKERENKILEDQEKEKTQLRQQKQVQIKKNKHIKKFCYLLHRINDDNFKELQTTLHMVKKTKQDYPTHFDTSTVFLKRRILELYNTEFEHFAMHCMFVLFDITI